jgi:hypothetical protein
MTSSSRQTSSTSSSRSSARGHGSILVTAASAFLASAPLGANAFRLGSGLWHTTEQQTQVEVFVTNVTIDAVLHTDPKDCDNHLTLHHGRPGSGEEDDAHWLVHEEAQSHFLSTMYQDELSPGTFMTDADADGHDDQLQLLFTPALSNANLIFWGSLHQASYVSMSFWNDTASVGEEWNSHHPAPRSLLHDWKFEDNSEASMMTEHALEQMFGTSESNHTNVMALDGEDGHDYVVLLPLASQNDSDAELELLMVNHVGYLARLRQSLPESTKLVVMVTEPIMASQHALQQQLEALDPEFVSERVVWMECRQSSVQTCHYRLHIQNGPGTIRVLRPESSPKHTDLLRMAREWISEMRRPPHTHNHVDNKSNAKTALYLKPSHPRHYPVLEQGVETEMLQIVQETLHAHGALCTLLQLSKS